jgi:hypothetical protein
MKSARLLLSAVLADSLYRYNRVPCSPSAGGWLSIAAIDVV